jgi:hypothetical protein
MDKNRITKPMSKTKKQEVAIRSSAAKYPTYALVAGADAQSVEVRLKEENLWMT